MRTVIRIVRVGRMPVGCIRFPWRAFVCSQSAVLRWVHSVGFVNYSCTHVFHMPKIHQSNASTSSHYSRDLLGSFDREPVVKLHKAVLPQTLGLSSFSAKKASVKSGTLENLKSAEEVVMKTKYLLPYGAGNQKTDISYTQGESWARQSMLRDNEFCQDPVQHAREAARYGAGNCAEHANVAYTLLASKQLNAPLMRVSDSQQDHAYVLVGDPRDPRWGEKDTVVVDGWVTHPSALTLEQSRDLAPGMPPIRQRPPGSAPDPDAIAAFKNVETISLPAVNQYLESRAAPPVGQGLMDYINQYQNTDRFFHEQTFARDPSTRYASSAFSSSSTDRILQRTVEGESAAYVAWQNNGFRW